jgi:hypothetical protein
MPSLNPLRGPAQGSGESVPPRLGKAPQPPRRSSSAPIAQPVPRQRPPSSSTRPFPSPTGPRKPSHAPPRRRVDWDQPFVGVAMLCLGLVVATATSFGWAIAAGGFALAIEPLAHSQPPRPRRRTSVRWLQLSAAASSTGWVLVDYRQVGLLAVILYLVAWIVLSNWLRKVYGDDGRSIDDIPTQDPSNWDGGAG